jgi:alpha-L-fucosidase
LKLISEGEVPLEVQLELSAPLLFDRILLQEPIREGQRISRFRVETENESGIWKEVARGTTVGYKRLLRISPVTARRLRIVVDEALYPPSLKRVGLYQASSGEPSY